MPAALWQASFFQTLTEDDDNEDIDYVEGEVNSQDVKFLIWMIISRYCGTENTPDPDGPLVNLLAYHLNPILDDHWENAPETTRVAAAIDTILSLNDFISLRSLMTWLVFDCYLTGIEGLHKKCEDDALNISLEYRDAGFEENVLLYSAVAQCSVSVLCPPLGVSAAVFLAEMARLKGLDNTAAILDGFEMLPQALYKITDENKDYFSLECIDCADCNQIIIGRKINLLRSSIKDDSFRKGMCIMGAFVKFGDNFEVNGMVSGMRSFTPEPESMSKYLRYNDKTIEKTIKHLKRLFGRKRIRFFSSIIENKIG